MATNEEHMLLARTRFHQCEFEDDFDSWKIRLLKGYIRGKPNGILYENPSNMDLLPHRGHRSSTNGSLHMVPDQGKSLILCSIDEWKNTKLEMVILKVKSSAGQGLPRHFFNILNQTSTAQEIWNNVELLMQGSGRTLQQRKEDLFDEYERFCAIGNESIHDYFVRFHKLVNDMKITQLEIPTHQMEH
ncbi:hypothetical protein Tco_1458414 [Tanacetum coccineum]